VLVLQRWGRALIDRAATGRAIATGNDLAVFGVGDIPGTARGGTRRIWGIGRRVSSTMTSGCRVTTSRLALEEAGETKDRSTGLTPVTQKS